MCALCDLCETRRLDDEDTLMECVECASIVHPTCMDPTGYYFIVPDVNNCWKCPKCCDEATVSVSLKMAPYCFLKSGKKVNLKKCEWMFRKRIELKLCI